MKELIKELKTIKEKKLTIFEKTIVFKQLEKKYNIWNSDIVELYYNL